MSPKEAQRVLETLAGGIDPETGEALPRGTALDQPAVIRALFLGAKALAAPEATVRTKPPGPPKAGKAWDADEKAELLRGFDAGQTAERLAAKHGRSPGGIAARLVRMGRITERSEFFTRAQRTG